MDRPLNIVLFDTEKSHADLLPLSYTRPVAEFRIGILTIREKWERRLNVSCSYLSADHLREKFPFVEAEDAIYVRGSVIPDDNFIKALLALNPGEALFYKERMMAARVAYCDFLSANYSKIDYNDDLDVIVYPFDIFRLNGKAIRDDYALIVKGRKSQKLPDGSTLIGDHKLPDGLPSVFIEEGAELTACVLNVTGGPIYIGKNAAVMECASLRGPIALCDNVKIKMGARIYPDTTFGPYCKIGGEVDNTVIFGYSNKAHDGYLGNAVIGEWCNIGAGTNASNLKNDYTKIRVWNYPSHSFMRTDLQFCGLIMGDHSKAGINTMFNTATVIGVGVNIHGSGFPRTFIPGFSEGSPAGGMTDVPLKKFCQIAERVMARRNVPLTDADRRMFESVFETASHYKHS